MKSIAKVLLASLAPKIVSASDAAPVTKVLSMISELQAKVIAEGEASHKEYAEFAEWCEDRASNLGFEIKTGQSQVNMLNGVIAKETATTAALTTRQEALATELGKDEADLKAATWIRNTEQASFAASEKNLMEIVDMLGRAAVIIEREMSGGASMLQLQSAHSLEKALEVLVQASLIQSADASKLAAFVQQADQEDDGDVNAPAGAVYVSHSGDILNTLQDLKDKAETQLADARHKETADTHSFEMLRQSLQDEIAYGQKELAEAKTGLSESAERKATAEGDLAVTTKDLNDDISTKATLHHDCMTRANNFEAEQKSRGEELAALAKAKQIIREATGSSNFVSSSGVSFLQRSTSQLASGADLAIFESVRFVRDLAQKQHSKSLAQLAARMSTAMNMHSGDQFKKVKGLIRDMIAKLEAERDADATRKMWCDRNLADARQRKSDKTAEIAKLTTRIDSMNARSAQLKSEVAALQEALANLASSQAEMTKLRQEAKAAFEAAKADLEQGLQGLKLAIQILNEYYAKSDKAHEAADGAGSGIIGLLEVCESDFTQDLARATADEESQVAEYERMSNANEIEREAKIQDVHYKSKESKALDADSHELTGDRSTVQVELDATNEALAKLEEQCIDRAETYAERAARHAAEIAGLKQALSILENETAFLQRASSSKLRGR